MVDFESIVVVALACNSSIDANVLAGDPSGLLVDQEKYGIANILSSSGTVFGPRQGYFRGHEGFLVPLGVYVGQNWPGGYGVDGEALAPAEL